MKEGRYMRVDDINIDMLLYTEPKRMKENYPGICDKYKL